MSATLTRDRASAPARQQTINIRAQHQQVALIDQAADAVGQTRSAFMLERSVHAAENVLLDKRLFSVDDATYDRFQASLDAPVDTTKLRDLLSQKAPWDR